MKTEIEFIKKFKIRLQQLRYWKFLIILVISFTAQLSTSGQDLSTIQNRVNELKSSIDSLELIINKSELLKDSLEKEYQIAKAKISTIEENQIRENGIETRIDHLSTDLRKVPFGEKIFEIESGEPIKVIGVKDNFYEIIYKGVKGYVGRQYIVETNEVKTFVNSANPRLKSLIQRFGESNGRRIYDGKVWIGMTTTEARASLGMPNDINTSTGSWGTRAQWVYSDKYLYFEDGKLTSWQN